MTQSGDIRGMKTYQQLYDYGFAAVGKLDARASEETDVTKRKALRAKSSEIMDFLFRLRAAELVELSTPTSQISAGTQLRNAVETAKKEMRKLEKLATALKAASDLLKMATLLVKLTV
ncbi:hypothetical protein A8B82_18015 [Sulfitobacter sp. EhC04]|uniref:hypothetical protein n=1 Tax=Sulfitobacter sp. EhC04 TaxID=1849168 RepID=UPI0007F53206|nr:hypothetical protein [Sulfitobacter sp. EhC04]OAN74652.1 hypothetical protein A8B82_18015 [Sulfitobacter sp. EhC04]